MCTRVRVLVHVLYVCVCVRCALVCAYVMCLCAYVARLCVRMCLVAYVPGCICARARMCLDARMGARVCVPVSTCEFFRTYLQLSGVENKTKKNIKIPLGTISGGSGSPSLSSSSSVPSRLRCLSCATSGSGRWQVLELATQHL